MPEDIVVGETPAVETPGDQGGTDAGSQTLEEMKVELDRVRDALKKANAESAKHRKEKDAATKAAEEAARKKAAEDGEWKRLYEESEAKNAAAEARAKTLELATLKRKVADTVKLPAGFADRLQGDTEEELTADARMVLELLPKPGAPNLNSGTGDGKTPKGGMTDNEIEDLSVRYGVSAKHMKEFLNG